MNHSLRNIFDNTSSSSLRVSFSTKAQQSLNVSNKALALAPTINNVLSGDFIAASLDNAEILQKFKPIQTAFDRARLLTDKIPPKALSVSAKAIPILGGLWTARSTLYESSEFLETGEYNKAAAVIGLGAVESVGNFFGFCAGSAAREVARVALIKTCGNEYSEIGKSDLRELSEAVFGYASEKVDLGLDINPLSSLGALKPDRSLLDTLRPQSLTQALPGITHP